MLIHLDVPSSGLNRKKRISSFFEVSWFPLGQRGTSQATGTKVDIVSCYRRWFSLLFFIVSSGTMLTWHQNDTDLNNVRTSTYLNRFWVHLEGLQDSITWNIFFSALFWYASEWVVSEYEQIIIKIQKGNTTSFCNFFYVAAPNKNLFFHSRTRLV